MFIVHFRLRKGVLAAGLAAAVMLVALAFILPGCSAKEEGTPIPAATEEERLAYLTGLGWAADSTPVETLDLQLPQQLDGDWAAYAQLQEAQGLPFLSCAGQQVRRYTYQITNYPGRDRDVQANLYVCNGQLIGGDIMALGKNGFQAGLAFPQQEKA